MCEGFFGACGQLISEAPLLPSIGQTTKAGKLYKLYKMMLLYRTLGPVLENSPNIGSPFQAVCDLQMKPELEAAGGIGLNRSILPAASWRRGGSCLPMRSREEGKNLLPACFTGPSESSVNPHDVPLRRQWTLSIAVPGSVIDNTQTVEQATAIAGQIARAAAIFNVDEVRLADCLSTRAEGDHMPTLYISPKWKPRCVIVCTVVPILLHPDLA